MKTKLGKSFEVVNRCDLCGSLDNKLFIEATDFTRSKRNFCYIKCNKCGLIWLSPRPKQRYIGEYYRGEYLAYKKIGSIGFFRRLIRGVLYRTFLSKIFIKDKLFFIENKGRLLDVGTGNGRYLDILKGWGFDVYGVEIDKKCVEDMRKRGLSIKRGDLFSAKYQASYFDYVRFSHVMEHVPSPLKELKETARILKTKGRVIILIPNIDSFFFRVFKRYWYPLEAPRHLYHYTPKTISKLLKRAGFTNITIQYNQSPYTLIRSLMYLTNSNMVNRRFGLFMYPLAILLRILNVLKRSDTLEVWASKK